MNACGNVDCSDLTDSQPVCPAFEVCRCGWPAAPAKHCRKCQHAQVCHVEQDKKSMLDAMIQAEIYQSKGDVEEAAFWHFKALTDPTQRAARARWGIPGLMGEREAFKAAMRLFKDRK